MLAKNDINHEGRATIVLINTIGMPVARQVTIQFVNKDMKSGVSIQYVPKGKRKPVATCFTNRLAVLPGWINVADVMGESNGGEWLSFDDEAFEKIVSGVDVQPVYIQ